MKEKEFRRNMAVFPIGSVMKLNFVLLHEGHYLMGVWAGWLVKKLEILSSHKNSFVSNYYYFVYTHHSVVVSHGFR